MTGEGVDRLRATHGDNYDRLRAAEATYDPENVFQENRNVEPAARDGADPVGGLDDGDGPRAPATSTDYCRQ